MKEHLETVIQYLEGNVDIYDGRHQRTLEIWNEAWDEMRWMGYNPDTIDGIKRYIKEQL